MGILTGLFLRGGYASRHAAPGGFLAEAFLALRAVRNAMPGGWL